MKSAGAARSLSLANLARSRSLLDYCEISDEVAADVVTTSRDQTLAKCTLIRRILKQSSSEALYLARGIIRSATPPPTDFGVTRLERTTANRHHTSIAPW